LLTSSKGPAGDDEFMRFVDFLETRCNKAGVKIEVGAEATPESVGESAPDAVVLATGATTAMPQIPGIDGDRVATVKQVMQGEIKAGENVVILGGRGTAIAAAQFLLHEGGHKIAMVEGAKKIGRDVNPSYIWRYVKKLKQGDVQVLTRCKPLSIGDDGVKIQDADGNELTLAADTVIVAVTAPANEMEAALKEKFGDRLHVIGDAAMPRRVHNATMDGHKVGLQL
jgi:pyruvate/2-oxoglutarate dehydrogenase complex dihydrolipoamide dehydrogenase (E3) component